MAKRKKIIQAGPLLKIAVYNAPEPKDTPTARAEKSRMTTAAQKAMNDKTARGKMEMTIAANFGRQDLFVTLTYRPEDYPKTRKEAIDRIRRFIRSLRTARKIRGADLRYIYVTENKHGEGRMHHHIVINAYGGDIEAIRSLWLWGDVVHVERLGRRGFDVWAGYMTKESGDRPLGARMWTPSKNLRKPIITMSWVSNTETAETPPGYVTIEEESKRGEYGSYRYIKCIRADFYRGYGNGRKERETTEWAHLYNNGIKLQNKSKEAQRRRLT